MTERPKILIVEDDIDMVEVMKITLKAKNYQVKNVFTPEEGLQTAKKEKPDLIILDVMFGSKGNAKGFDYAIKIRKNKTLAGIPILMISAVNVKKPGFGFSDQEGGEYLPIDGFIDKPAQPEDLVQKVEELLKLKVSSWINWPEKRKESGDE